MVGYEMAKVGIRNRMQPVCKREQEECLFFGKSGMDSVCSFSAGARAAFLFLWRGVGSAKLFTILSALKMCFHHLRHFRHFGAGSCFAEESEIWL